MLKLEADTVDPEERSLNFSIGSNVKLCSPLAAILDQMQTCWIQFLKGTTQGPLSPSLVPIGTVVPEEKIFEFFHRVQC